MDRTDGELIEEYRRGAEAAFAVLVRRHVDLVYAAALRLTRDPGLADDVTQAVFIVLAKKARRLRRHATIAGWLVVVTRYVARAAIRARARRRRHEFAAAAPTRETAMKQSDAASRELADALDDALPRLRAGDRDAIALRYLQSQSLAEVGSALGISEEAARKRVTRGIERLRSALARRGIGTSEAALSATVATFASPSAPAAVVLAVASAQITTPPSVVSLSKGVMHMFAMREVAVLCALVLLTFCAVAAVTVVAEETPARTSGATALQQPPAAVEPKPMNLGLNVVALQLGVTDVQANIDFFKKVGFGVRFLDKPDARGRLVRATVDSGSIRIRMYRVAAAPRPSKNMIPYFWIDSGYMLAKLRQQIAGRGIAVGPITGSGATLAQFDLVTPDGYTVGFYTQP